MEYIASWTEELEPDFIIEEVIHPETGKIIREKVQIKPENPFPGGLRIPEKDTPEGFREAYYPKKWALVEGKIQLSGYVPESILEPELALDYYGFLDAMMEGYQNG